MKKLVICYIAIALFLCGCAQKRFDPSLAGEITYSKVIWKNGQDKYYTCSIPTGEVRQIFQHAVPRGDRYSELTLVFDTQTASMQYDGKAVGIRWSSAKTAKPVIFLKIDGYGSHVLEEPYASEFLEALNKYEKPLSEKEQITKEHAIDIAKIFAINNRMDNIEKNPVIVKDDNSHWTIIFRKIAPPYVDPCERWISVNKNTGGCMEIPLE